MSSYTIKDRDRIVDEVLAIGVPSHLTSPLVYTPPSVARTWPATAIAIAILAVGSTAFAAVMAREIELPFASAVSRSSESASHDQKVRARRRTGGEFVAVTEPVAVAVAVTEPATVAQATPDAIASASAPMPTRSTVVAPITRAATPAPRTSSSRPATPAAPIDDSIDSLLDRALGSRESAPPGVVTVASPALPETPSQAQVLTALRALEREVRECSETSGSVITTRIVVDGATGRVTSASASGDLTPEARACVVRTLETARFSAFERDRFEVSFPYRL